MKLALLTPDPADETYAHRWMAAYEVYRDAFARAGVDMAPAAWTDPWPTDVAGVLALRAWGYHKQPKLWAERLSAERADVVNPLPALRWNTDKTYLAALAEVGIPVVPTRFVERPGHGDLDAAREAFGATRLVVKPVVSAGAFNTAVVAPGDEAPPIDGLAMIQPFLDAVGAEGELSLFYFGGVFSHAVRKVAAAGDFRVQPQHGGQLARMTPDAEMLAVGVAVLAAAPAGLVYARIDLIRGQDGALKLMELETIEPDLYFDVVPEAAGRLVEAVVVALKG